VTLHPSLNQPSTPSTAASLNGTIVTGGTGACVAGATYWDIGVRGDTGPTNHSSGFTLTPQYSVLTSLIGYTGHNNQAPSALGLVSQYCNGSRMPPEFASGGYQVPPGTNEGTVPVPVFSLLPGATVDEGNNWVNMKWGPLAMTSPMAPYGDSLGNYAPAPGSPAIDAIPVAQPHPSTDFFGNPRPSPSNHTAFDAGAVELQGPAVPVPTLTSISPSTGQRGTVVPVTLSGTNLTGTSAVTVSGTGINVSNITVVNSTTVSATFTISGTATVSTRTVSVTTPGGTSNTLNFTVNAGTLTFSSATNGTLASFLGVRTLTFNVPSSRAAVTSVVTMTNTGAAPLQITAETITANSARFSVTGTTCSFTTPLAPGASCTVTVRYATPASRPLFPNLGALTVANNGTTSGLLALSGQ
jgi:hypothetical protein